MCQFSKGIQAPVVPFAFPSLVGTKTRFYIGEPLLPIISSFQGLDVSSSHLPGYSVPFRKGHMTQTEQREPSLRFFLETLCKS